MEVTPCGCDPNFVRWQCWAARNYHARVGIRRIEYTAPRSFLALLAKVVDRITFKLTLSAVFELMG